MKYLAVFVFILLPSVALADMNPTRLKILLQICDTARRTSDLGTVNNIANQIKNSERPSDRSLATQYDQCLLVALGKTEQSPSSSALLSRIEKTAIRLEKDCRELLEVAPSVAVSNPICKGILLR